MKITFVMPAARGSGGSRVVAIYAKHLAARGHEVRVVWHRMSPVPWRQKLRNWLKGNDRRAKISNPYFEGSAVKQITAAAPGVVGDADIPDGDVVVATWWKTAFEVADLSPAKGRKFYFVQHHEVHDHLPLDLVRSSYHLPLRKIAIAGWLRRVMAEEYGDTDVALVPNSVDAELFHAPERTKNPRPVVGFMYSETRFKGVDIIVRAIAEARERVPELEVVAFGKKRPAAHLPLPPGTTYVQDPPQERLRELYASCDMWLMGSRSEGFGLPLLEAMACRTPVISTRTGAAEDLIRDGSEGFVVDVDDAETMGARIAKLASLDPEEWERMSQAAHAQARSYSWEDATDLFEAELRGRSEPTAEDHCAGERGKIRSLDRYLP